MTGSSNTRWVMSRQLELNDAQHFTVHRNVVIAAAEDDVHSGSPLPSTVTVSRNESPTMPPGDAARLRVDFLAMPAQDDKTS